MCEATTRSTEINFFSFCYYNLQCFDSDSLCSGQRLQVREFMDDNCGMMFIPLLFHSVVFIIIREPPSALRGTKGKYAASGGADMGLYLESTVFQIGRNIFGVLQFLWHSSIQLRELRMISAVLLGVAVESEAILNNQWIRRKGPRFLKRGTLFSLKCISLMCVLSSDI